MSTVALAGILLTAGGVNAVLLGDRSGRRPVEYVAKPLASAGFLIVALATGALDSGYGVWILAGLGLSLCGDVFLMFKLDWLFLAGLAAFLLGHVAFVIAFAVVGVSGAWAGLAAIGAVGAALIVLRWLMPHVDSEMRSPVMAYVAVISAMVVLAVGTRGAGATPLIVFGAAMFYLSDLFVARDRFVTPGFVNRLVGLPLYYLGQILLALSVAG